jgi:hypothetical protein
LRAASSSDHGACNDAADKMRRKTEVKGIEDRQSKSESDTLQTVIAAGSKNTMGHKHLHAIQQRTTHTDL